MISFKPLYGLLAERGLSAKWVADSLGIDKQSMYRIKRTGRCSTDEIDAMCRLLNVGVGDVIRYEEGSHDKHEEDEEAARGEGHELPQAGGGDGAEQRDDVQD